VPLALVAYAVFGTSRRLFVGPSSTVAAVSAAVVAPLVLNGGEEKYVALTIALALLVGVLFILAGIARFGFIARFFAKPVLDGFIIGLALFIAVGQLDKIFGVKASGGNTIAKFIDVFRQAGQWSWLTIAVGSGCLLLLFAFHRFTPRVPGALVVMMLAIVIAFLFALGDQGVHLVGEIPSGLPTWSLKGVSIEEVFNLLPGALGLLVVAFAQSMAVAKSYASKYKYKIDVNQEMIAYGAANLGAGIFQGFAVNGSLSKTAANDDAGGKTPMVLIACSVLTLLTMLFLASLFRDLPEATLAAVVIHAVAGVIGLNSFKRYYRVKKADFVLALGALLGVLLLGILEGIIIGIVLSLIAFINRTSRPHSAVLGVDSSGTRYADVREHPDYRLPVSDVILYRFDAPLIFANVDVFSDEIKELVEEAEPSPKAVIIDCEMMYEMDTTATDGFTDLYLSLSDEGIEVLLARVHKPVLEFMRRDGAVEVVGEENIFPTVRDAVKAFRERHHEDE